MFKMLTIMHMIIDFRFIRLRVFINPSVQAPVRFPDVGCITPWADKFIHDGAFVGFRRRIFLRSETVAICGFPVVHEFHRLFE